MSIRPATKTRITNRVIKSLTETWTKYVILSDADYENFVNGELYDIAFPVAHNMIAICNIEQTIPQPNKSHRVSFTRYYKAHAPTKETPTVLSPINIPVKSNEDITLLFAQRYLIALTELDRFWSYFHTIEELQDAVLEGFLNFISPSTDEDTLKLLKDKILLAQNAIVGHIGTVQQSLIADKEDEKVEIPNPDPKQRQQAFNILQLNEEEIALIKTTAGIVYKDYDNALTESGVLFDLFFGTQDETPTTPKIKTPPKSKKAADPPKEENAEGEKKDDFFVPKEGEDIAAFCLRLEEKFIEVFTDLVRTKVIIRTGFFEDISDALIEYNLIRKIVSIFCDIPDNTPIPEMRSLYYYSNIANGLATSKERVAQFTCRSESLEVLAEMDLQKLQLQQLAAELKDKILKAFKATYSQLTTATDITQYLQEEYAIESEGKSTNRAATILRKAAFIKTHQSFLDLVQKEVEGGNKSIEAFKEDYQSLIDSYIEANAELSRLSQDIYNKRFTTYYIESNFIFVSTDQFIRSQDLTKITNEQIAALTKQEWKLCEALLIIMGINAEKVASGNATQYELDSVNSVITLIKLIKDYEAMDEEYNVLSLFLAIVARPRDAEGNPVRFDPNQAYINAKYIYEDLPLDTARAAYNFFFSQS